MKFVKFHYPQTGETAYLNIEMVKEVTIHRGEVIVAHLSYIGGMTRVITGDCVEELIRVLDEQAIDLPSK